MLSMFTASWHAPLLVIFARLQEVFLRLAAQNKGVNYTDEDFSQEPVAAPATGAARKCLLCNVAKPELVTLFTIKVGLASLSPM
jgi:hypothetical protein